MYFINAKIILIAKKKKKTNWPKMIKFLCDMFAVPTP